MTTPARSRVLALDLALVGVVPRIWRRLTVPSDLSLLDLHHAIQIVMGWRDVHLHVFEIHDREYGPRPEEEWEREQWAGDDAAITIARALTLADGSLDYIYDLGDDWRIRVKGIGDSAGDTAASVTCLDGERAGPPEDCGGPVIYQELLDAWSDGARRTLRSPAPAGFDPAAFDLDAAERTAATGVSAEGVTRSACRRSRLGAATAAGHAHPGHAGPGRATRQTRST